jgi:hypothetical protein
VGTHEITVTFPYSLGITIILPENGKMVTLDRSLVITEENIGGTWKVSLLSTFMSSEITFTADGTFALTGYEI